MGTTETFANWESGSRRTARGKEFAKPPLVGEGIQLRRRISTVRRTILHATLRMTALLSLVSTGLTQSERHEPIVPQLTTSPTLSVSTVPSNGDLNPYGVAFVPHGFAAGKLNPGDVIVSNFNDSANVQGTGTTIVSISSSVQQSLFFQGQPGLGFTTALGSLKRGFVLVGSVPTTDGTCATIGQTSLLILDHSGSLVTTLTDLNLLDGPWDLTINDRGEQAEVFVSNVLSGTVTRINLRIPKNGNPIVEGMTQIASGYGHACNAAAVVVGPTGLAYDAAKDLLHVASTSDNAVFALPHARKTAGNEGTGSLVYQDNTHLPGPLGLLLAPTGDLITAKGDARNPDASRPRD